MDTEKFFSSQKLSICFAHNSYQFSQPFLRRGLKLPHCEVQSFTDLKSKIDDIDILVISGLWRNELLERGSRLKFVQSISAGIDQFDINMFKKFNVRLSSGKGVNARAVSEHAIAMLLSLTRQLNLARDNQQKKYWRPMIGDSLSREQEINGKTLLVIGLGSIGEHVARLGLAFNMKVIATRKDLTKQSPKNIHVYPLSVLRKIIPKADVIVLTCPLVPETTGLIGAQEFDLMKPSVYLINISRGDVVDEKALVHSLKTRKIAGAGIDVTSEEPLPPRSLLWGLHNVILSPHSAGETNRYEENVIDILIENIERLKLGKSELMNQIV